MFIAPSTQDPLGDDIRVVLLFGGTSDEHRVSVASAQHMAAAMPDAVAWFIDPAGGVRVVDRAALLAFENAFVEDFQPDIPARWKDLEAALDDAGRERVFFLALHGGEGEDGTLQRLFEARGIAYTGSDACSSALAWDKEAAKAAVRSRGVEVPPARLLPSDAEAAADMLTDALIEWGGVVVKPICGGSSLGVSMLRRGDAVDALAREAAASSVPVIVERLVEGIELTIGVVCEDGGPRALPVSEIRLESATSFDFASKYLGRGAREITPAEIPVGLAEAAQRIAIQCHEALGCAGYSRTDLIADGERLLFLETNTLPGLTRESFIPQQLAASGRTMEGFVHNQVALAATRASR